MKKQTRLRNCVFCNREIHRCNGFVKARDFLEALDGKREIQNVREICGLCALIPLVPKYFSTELIERFCEVAEVTSLLPNLLKEKAA